MDWIIKYIEHMCNNDTESAIMLKEQYIPKTLFKYRALNDFALENLESDTIWLSDINALNDPFELEMSFDLSDIFSDYFSSSLFANGFKSQFGYEINKLELDEIINSKDPLQTYSQYRHRHNIVLNIDQDAQLKKVKKTFEDVNFYIKNQVRIFSMSERKDSILMWSHYSIHHQGICIEYDTNSFNGHRAFLQPVFYSKELFKIKKTNDINPTNAMMALLYKSKDWNYEKEWRLNILQHLNTNNNLINISTPKAVYLGMRYNLNSSYKKKQLMRICKEKNIPVFQMKIHPREYKIIKDFEVKF